MEAAKRTIPSVKKIFIVASGKGGVGKSTVSCLLARQLAAKNLKVGILDADIYGPSIPTILDVEDLEPEVDAGKFQPIIKDGLKLMSIGFLVPTTSSLAWRGPMITKTLSQLLFSTNWGELDCLIIDTPPGTGDIHISLANICKIDGAIIVTLPDKLSTRDAERAMDLCNKTYVKILGIIENMCHIDTDSGALKPFGKSCVEDLAERLSAKIIARLPLVPSLYENQEIYKIPELQISFEL